MTLIMYQSGLWDSDLSRLIKEGESKSYEVEYGLEEDNYHYWIEWRMFP